MLIVTCTTGSTQCNNNSFHFQLSINKATSQGSFPQLTHTWNCNSFHATKQNRVNSLKHRNITMRHIRNKIQTQSTEYDFKRFEDLFEKKAQLISANRQATWRNQFEEIKSDIVSIPGFEMLTDTDTNTWITEINNYNTPHGKGIRAYQLILSDMYLSNDKSPENDREVNILAWLLEM
ncbi:unnamed protein product, partial [Allacma fusca]